jgi:hypothetical protein
MACGSGKTGFSLISKSLMAGFQEVTRFPAYVRWALEWRGLNPPFGDKLPARPGKASSTLLPRWSPI